MKNWRWYKHHHSKYCQENNTQACELKVHSNCRDVHMWQKWPLIDNVSFVSWESYFLLLLKMWDQLYYLSCITKNSSKIAHCSNKNKRAQFSKRLVVHDFYKKSVIYPDRIEDCDPMWPLTSAWDDTFIPVFCCHRLLMTHRSPSSAAAFPAAHHLPLSGRRPPQHWEGCNYEPPKPGTGGLQASRIMCEMFQPNLLFMGIWDCCLVSFCGWSACYMPGFVR